MLLAEPVFLSLQGEWPNVWKPSVFVRFFWCNKLCKRCDSLYAVNNTESLVDVSIDELVEQIRWFKCSNIVFTWGEPGLFEDNISKIMSYFKWRFTFEIETNWSVPLKLDYDQINISPKMSNSWNAKYKVVALDNYEKLWERNYCFKFVAKGKEDFDEILECIKENNVQKEDVYIMPLGTTAESQMNKEVLDFCLENWFRYCQRMNILLFWNKKWV